LDISRTFRATGTTNTRKIKTNYSAPQRTVYIDGSQYSVTLSNTSADVGYRFRLYDINGVDYIDLEVTADYPNGSIDNNIIGLKIYDRINEEKYIQLATVLHDKTRFKNLNDRRLFGTVGRKDVRSDYTRDYISYPTSLLRGNGIIYGCAVEKLTGKVAISGGQVLTNGVIYSIEESIFNIPNDDGTYNIFINSDGIIRILKDNDSSTGPSPLLTKWLTPSISEIISSSDKTILAQFAVSSGAISGDIIDYRRFVNNLDNKIELLVEENDITHGSFASLQAAINYLNVSGSLPISRTIKMRGEVFVSSSVSLPENIIFKMILGII
jgi:hypothetical protein